MQPMRLILLIVSSLLLSAGFADAQDLELFVSVRDDCVQSGASDATLYSVNPATAQSNPIGPIGFLGVTALEFLPDGRLVGSARQDTGPERPEDFVAILIEINQATGMGSLIGEIGATANVGEECGRAPGLTYDSSTDTLFATGEPSWVITAAFMSVVLCPL